MKFMFFRTVFWFWFTTRGYYIWSRFWRWLLERDYLQQKLTEYTHVNQLEEHLSKMTWTRDPLNGLFDVISSPHKVEAVLQKKLGGEADVADVGDCDEFAQYAADRLQNMIERGVSSMQQPLFVTLNWLDKNGKFHGHNICCFYDPTQKRWGHIGNWFDGKAQIGFDDLDDIADWFALRNPRDGKGRLIAYAAATPDLKLKYLVLG